MGDPVVIACAVAGVVVLGVIIAVLCVVLKKYTMTFNTNGVKFNEEILPIKARKGQTIYLPELISPKHEFLGWFYDKKCTQKFEGEKMIKGDVVLYAGWKKKKEKNNVANTLNYTDYIMHNISFNIALDW